jgi:hypothetical protein
MQYPDSFTRSSTSPRSATTRTSTPGSSTFMTARSCIQPHTGDMTVLPGRKRRPLIAHSPAPPLARRLPRCPRDFQQRLHCENTGPVVVLPAQLTHRSSSSRPESTICRAASCSCTRSSTPSTMLNNSGSPPNRSFTARPTCSSTRRPANEEVGAARQLEEVHTGAPPPSTVHRGDVLEYAHVCPHRPRYADYGADWGAAS